MIDIIRLYQDFRIPYQLAGHKHVSSGWVGIPCPFCSGNPGHHLGFCMDSGSKFHGAFACWRCGGKGTQKVISKILSVSEPEARKLLKRYRTGEKPTEPTQIRTRKRTHTECRMPPGTTNLAHVHRAYLEKRRYDPDKVEREWDLKGTGPVGPFNHRIMIPVTYLSKVVSYQGRDITGRSGMKYKACQQELELRDHKHCLYGLDKISRPRCVVVEGVMDVWRLGVGAVATFGVKYTPAQLNLLKMMASVFILYDQDPEAVEQANRMSAQLSSLGIGVEIITLESGDPDDLSDKEAQELMVDIMG